VQTLRGSYDEHEACAIALNGAAPSLLNWPHVSGAHGLAGRASAQAFDLRSDLPCEAVSTAARD